MTKIYIFTVVYAAENCVMFVARKTKLEINLFDSTDLRRTVYGVINMD